MLGCCSWSQPGAGAAVGQHWPLPGAGVTTNPGCREYPARPRDQGTAGHVLQLLEACQDGTAAESHPFVSECSSVTGAAAPQTMLSLSEAPQGARGCSDQMCPSIQTRSSLLS